MKPILALAALFALFTAVFADIDHEHLTRADSVVFPNPYDLPDLYGNEGETSELQTITLSHQGDTGLLLNTNSGGTGGEVFAIYTRCNGLWNGKGFFGFPRFDKSPDTFYRIFVTSRNGMGSYGWGFYEMIDTMYECIFAQWLEHDPVTDIPTPVVISIDEPEPENEAPPEKWGWSACVDYTFRPLPTDGYQFPKITDTTPFLPKNNKLIIERDINGDGIPELIVPAGEDDADTHSFTHRY